MKEDSINLEIDGIEFTLIRKDVKNININVKPDLTILVSAPSKLQEEKVKEFVLKKRKWIKKNINYFKKNRPTPKTKKEYISGETFRYLGKQYRLKVIEDENEEGVKYFRGFIYLNIKNKNDIKSKEDLIKDWYHVREEILFNQSLNRMYKLIKKYDIEKPTIKPRKLKSRWGSCNKSKNEILLNSDLIEAPKFAIDYVVLHELIHFKYDNHNKDFFNLLTALMPDWEMRKNILDCEIIRDL